MLKRRVGKVPLACPFANYVARTVARGCVAKSIEWAMPDLRPSGRCSSDPRVSSRGQAALAPSDRPRLAMQSGCQPILPQPSLEGACGAVHARRPERRFTLRSRCAAFAGAYRPQIVVREQPGAVSDGLPNYGAVSDGLPNHELAPSLKVLSRGYECRD